GIVALLAIGRSVIGLLSTSTVRLLLSSHILPITLLTISRSVVGLLAIGRSVIGLLSTCTVRLLRSSHILPITLLTISRSVVGLLAIGRSVIGLLSTSTVRLLLSSHILPITLLTISRGIVALLSTLTGGLRVTRAGEGLLGTGCLWELLRVVLTCLRSRPRDQVRVPESLQQEEPEQSENGAVSTRGEETGESV